MFQLHMIFLELIQAFLMPADKMHSDFVTHKVQLVFDIQKWNHAHVCEID